MEASLVYLGRDNAIARELLLDGLPMTLTEITRVVLSLKGSGQLSLDSQTNPALFDWASRYGVVQVRAGHAPGLSAGRWTATLTLYANAYPAGLVVPPFPVDVRAA